jgi:hypothetical protein
MERNRWEKAIRCLEVALHPNTTDGEVIAGVNGFRRTAGGTPLGDICRELAGAGQPEAEPNSAHPARQAEAPADPVADAALDALSRENLALRRKLEREREDQAAALTRLRDAERLVLALGDEIRAEQQSFADFRAASAQIVGGLKGDNFDLRGALEQARVEQATLNAARRPVFSPFRDLLAATLERKGQTGPALSAGAPPPRAPAPRHPWTA